MRATPGITQLEGEAAKAARDAIGVAMDAFNDARTGLHDPSRPLALVIGGQQPGDVAGGLWAISYYGWLFIELLVLPDTMRGRGLGTLLMDRAEQVARARGCTGIWLDTFSFQARGFYEKRGYQVFGEIEDYPPGQTRFWMKKRLTPLPPDG